MGKLVFGRRLAALLLCLDPPAHAGACGNCHGCRLHAAGNHPDYLELTVADGKTQISVDQVRDMSAHLALKSHAGGNKVALLWPAERMNANAANSLLKTLEEPPDATTLILCCSSLSALPATVVSRCQRIIFTRPPLDIALGWLESVSSEADWRRLLAAADGAPLAAVELHRSGYLDAVIAWQEQLLAIVDGSMDPCSIAAKWSRDDPRLVLRWLQRLVETGVCLNSGALDVNQVEESMDGRLQNVFANLNIVKLMEYLEWLRWLLHGIERPLNLQLAFEGVLIPWSQGLRLVQQVPGGSV
jgi:DNA polymerase-3 subunit delta'